jgi:L-seryl-tRNA(Ser) seleniumtransferase
LLNQIGANPLHRAVRCDKLTLAALEATLRIYQQSADLVHEIPTLRTFTRSLAELDAIGNQVAPLLRSTLGEGFRVTLENGSSQIGSGALPTEELPTRVLAVESETMSAERLAQRFRAARPPIIGRIKDGRFLLDLRTILDGNDLVPRWIAAD